ncbi:MAG: hypothetical protein SF123_07645 [Chloroflexota bacterium]|nr:hypothetical protein [Chloroflexota bacterium]
MRETRKFKAGVQLAKQLTGQVRFDSNDDLNDLLAGEGYQWDNRKGSWEKKPTDQLRDGEPGLFRVRIHGNQSEIGDFVDEFVAFTKQQGGTVQEVSEFYPNVRKAGDTGGRIYITLKMEQ